MQQALSTRFDESANAVFANIGQIDDKLDRLAAADPRAEKKTGGLQ